MSFKQWALDTADRALSTLVQAAVMFAIAAQSGESEGTPKALLAAALPAVATVLLSAFPQLKYTGPNYWIDVAVRIARTFGTTVLGAAVADQQFDWLDLSSWKIVALAGGSAILVIVKGEISKRLRPDSITPASLVTNEQFNKAA